MNTLTHTQDMLAFAWWIALSVSVLLDVLRLGDDHAVAVLLDSQASFTDCCLHGLG